MKFHESEVIPTTLAVYIAIYAEHRDQLETFSTYTNVDECRIETLWGFVGSDRPLIGIKTSWDPELKDSVKEHNCFLVVAVKEESE